MELEDGDSVYGTQEDSHVMSERVQSLAASIYKEFERMIGTYDENVVKELMPLVVGILESLDQGYIDKQETEVELELLRDDNEQLLTQYEREKQLRKAAEAKYLEVEDARDEEIKELESKTESLESIVRMFELKAKNAHDHINRLDDKEAEMRKEYNKLHERYTELFKTHMDYMERTKILMGGDKITDQGVSGGRKSGFTLPNLKAVTPGGSFPPGETPIQSGTTPSDFVSPGFPTTPSGQRVPPSSLQNELSELEKQRKDSQNKNTATDAVEVKDRSAGTKEAQETENVNQEEGKDISEHTISSSFEQHLVPSPAFRSEALPSSVTDLIASTPELEDIDESGYPTSKAARQKQENDSSIFEELSTQDSGAAGQVDDGIDITGKVVNPAEFASSDPENEEDTESNAADNFFGMGREIENLILENTELLATKNALNVVKDDLIAKVDELTSEQEILREEIASLQAVKTRLKQRVTELEDDLKKSKEELEKAKQTGTNQGEEGEDEVPMAQRKRFTRVEMARVLMERNQYKERLMELQEAVRWTEMIRASREHPELSSGIKKKSSMWNFFSNLFSSSNKPAKKPLPPASVKYSAPTTSIQPSGDPNKRQRDKYNLGEKAKAYDFLGQEDAISEKKRKEREKERRDQYKQVQVHVKKDDGRLQAYGWSLPARVQPASIQKDAPRQSQVPVPVPVYCRPLLEQANGMKIWCAAGVNLTGGKTRDGGSIVGASVFYSDLPASKNKAIQSGDDVEKLDQELKEHEKDAKDFEKEQMSSLVWICTTTHSSSRVSVVDANNPADVLETFHVTSSHLLCIASVPGAMESDYPADEEMFKCEFDEPKTPTPQPSPKRKPPGEQGEGESVQSDSMAIGNVTFVQCSTGTNSKNSSAAASPMGTPPVKRKGSAASTEGDNKAKEEASGSMEEDHKAKVKKATGSPSRSASSTPSSTPKREKRLLKAPNELVKDGISAVPTDNDFMYVEVEKASSVLPTMWLGSQSGSLYVHSAVSQWKRCLHSVKLKDSVLNIVHVKGRVLVALADGTVAVFHRSQDGQWDLTNYHVVDLGKPHHSVRCMCIIANTHVWCGYRNKIHVLDPKTLKVEKSFDAHPRKESQVRQLAWVGDGVWVSIRLDSTLRLYHAYTHQHLQDVDIEPYVSKMLGTGKLGFSFVRITALLISVNRLWIGTGNGVIISVPLSENNKQAMTTSTAGRPGGVIRVYSDSRGDSVTPGTFIPYCSMAQAQLSFHGHRDAVKFFSAVPGTPSKGLSGVKSSKDNKDGDKNKSETSKNMLVISGGEGYIDFRLDDNNPFGKWTGETDDDDDNDKSSNKDGGLSKGDRSHLIVWQVFTNK